MAVVLLDEYKSAKSKDTRQEVLEERTRILETVSRKAQARTLTLQETTDLYAKFNSTYESTYRRSKKKEDESWALKLLQECEDDIVNSTFETRINGVPLEAKSPVQAIKPVPQPPLLDSYVRLENELMVDEDEFITVDEQPTLKDSFIYDQVVANHTDQGTQKKSHQPLVLVMAISVVLTLSGLIGIALFL